MPKGIRIVPAIHGRNLWVWIDRSHLSQALLNLVLNARDALGSSGIITLSATRKVLSPPFRPSSAPPPVCVSVSDNGPGIDERIARTIFEPFVSTKSHSGTRGLGLSMVKTLIERNGGEVAVTTARGIGTTFTLSIPSGCRPSTLRGATIPTKDPAHLNPRTSLTILVADDDAEVREIFLRALRSRGHQPVAVPNAVVALQELSLPESSFEVVIIDDGMPGSSAASLCEAIQRIRPEVPIIVTSGSRSVANLPIDQTKRRFLAKPFSLEELFTTVESFETTTE